MGRLKQDALVSASRYTAAMTLGDLMNQGLDVFCWCNRCGHNAVLQARLLSGQMGAAQAVPEVGARLRCSGCASKDVATRPAWPSLDPVVGDAHGPQDREELPQDQAA
ncbi:MAG: hypothetical protein OEQ29_18550, partial [Alphaproteobacteria bacterium]|nr:hypothetical protein [Alphaproteobacteria bacterium]